MSGGTGEGKETVLVVDDDPQVRQFICDVLREDGYTVLEASEEKLALRICDEQGAAIRLLVMDMLLDGVRGNKLAPQIRSRLPGVKILYVSGSLDHAVVQAFAKRADAIFLKKPFPPDALLSKAKELLGKETA